MMNFIGKKMLKRAIALGALLCTMTAMTFAGASAKEEAAKKAAKKDAVYWVKLCDKTKFKDPKTKKDIVKNVCRTVHERLDAPFGAAIRSIDGEKKKRLTIIVPLATAIPAGVRVTIDKNESLPFKFLMCLPSGCMVEGEATDKLIKQMKSGNRMVVSVMRMNLKWGHLPISLKGFSGAYEGKPVDSKKYAQARKRSMQELHRIRTEMIKKEREKLGEQAKKEALEQIEKHEKKAKK